jgi:hypothetical protein
MTKSQLEDLNISEVPVGAFSASFVRNIVKYDLKDKFYDIYKNYLNDDKIEQLYSQIKDGLLLGNKKSKGTSKPPIQKYRYPLIKGTENYESALKSKSTKRKRDDVSGGKKLNKSKKIKPSKGQKKSAKSKIVKKTKRVKRNK